MARLYEYADSSDKTGYFVRGGTSDSNYTMRSTDLGKRLFDQLGYEPSIVNKERGPRIPSHLLWAMYDVGLLKTGGKEPSGAGFDGELSIEDAELTESQMEALEEFVLKENADKEEVQELANILDVDLEESSRTPIWMLDESARKNLESVYQTKIAEELETDEIELIVRYESDISHDDYLIYGVDIVSEQKDMDDYYHQMIYCRGGNNGVNVVTRDDIDLDERVLIDRQRGALLEAMSEVPLLTGLEIGDPGEDLGLVALEGELTKEY